MTRACIKARDLFAAAPSPVDQASDAAFLDASDEAVRAATFPARDLTEEVENPALREMHFQLDNFPRLVGAHETIGVAFEARAAIMRLDRFAQQLGVPACGAATWRPDAWASLTDRAADRPTEERFTADLDTLCFDTFGDLPQGHADSVARAVAGVSARSAINEFERALLRMPPPPSMEDKYISLIAALLDLDAAIPDVAPTDPPPDYQERFAAARASVVAAIDDLGLSC